MDRINLCFITLFIYLCFDSFSKKYNTVVFSCIVIQEKKKKKKRNIKLKVFCNLFIYLFSKVNKKKKSTSKVQGVPQSQTAALPRPKEEEETDKSKQAQTEQTYEKHKISSLFPKRGNRDTKRTEKHKNKKTHGKTYNKSPCTINHKATRSKTPGPPP